MRATRIGAVLLVLAIVAVSAFVIRHIYLREMTQARREMLSFDDLLAEQTVQAFRNVELVQNKVAEDLMAAGLSGPDDLARIGGTQEMHERLRQAISGIPQLDAVTLISPNGQLINFSRAWPIPPVNVSDRDYFRALSAPAAAGSFIGEPVHARVSGHSTIYLAHRILDGSGRFAGLILAAMRLDYFEGVYSSLSLPEGSNIALVRQDGLLLAHYPLLSAGARRTVPDPELSRLGPGESRTFITSHTIDGRRRLIARTRLEGQPIMVTYSRAMGLVLSDWQFDAEIVAAAALLCIVAVLVLAKLVNQQFRAYEAAAGALAARETAERGLREAEAKLLQGQKLEAVGRLSAGIAHDFNNLLTVVRANAEMMLSSDLGERVTRRIATICQAVDRGATLTQQMLAFSRQQMLTPRSLDLNGRLDSIAELLRSSVGGRIRLELLPGERLWPAFADAAQLEQALLNLVLNARDAVAGGGVVTIQTANRRVGNADASGQIQPGDYVAVCVADTGDGMTPEVMHRAFDPFFTTKEQGKGSGLGLSQVIGFARQSNGDVQIESTPGAGTRITILLPRSVHPALPDAGAEPQAAAQREEMPTVLLVDDDPMVRTAAAAILRRHGFAVVEAEGGPAALQLAEEQGIGLVLTDYVMPEMTGKELAARLRQDVPARPVVFMTGFTQPEQLRGERWVISKPFDAESLCRVLAEAWGEYRQSFFPTCPPHAAP